MERFQPETPPPNMKSCIPKLMLQTLQILKPIPRITTSGTRSHNHPNYRPHLAIHGSTLCLPNTSSQDDAGSCTLRGLNTNFPKQSMLHPEPLRWQSQNCGSRYRTPTHCLSIISRWSCAITGLSRLYLEIQGANVQAPV